jgi:hypothetical protein
MLTRIRVVWVDSTIDKQVGSVVKQHRILSAAVAAPLTCPSATSPDVSPTRLVVQAPAQLSVSGQFLVDAFPISLPKASEALLLS